MRFAARLEEFGDVLGPEQAGQDEPDQVALSIDLKGEDGGHRGCLA
jgi:hypothetical protein